MAGKIYDKKFINHKAYGDGVRAKQAGELISTNPHTVGTETANAWDAGWTAGTNTPY